MPYARSESDDSIGPPSPTHLNRATSFQSDSGDNNSHDAADVKPSSSAVQPLSFQRLSMKNLGIYDDDEEESTAGSDIFKKLYADRYPSDHGKTVSRNERKREGYLSTTLTYGEIMFDTFSDLFSIIKGIPGSDGNKLSLPIKGEGVFVDVGCGTGKAVFAASLLWEFKECVGVEILEDLHAVCLETLAYYNTSFPLLLPSPSTTPTPTSTSTPTSLLSPTTPPLTTTSAPNSTDTTFTFANTDFLLYDWSNADIVFMNSTCFSTSLMIDLSYKCQLLKPGAIVITTTKKLIGRGFEVLEWKDMEESWGEARVYIQRVLNKRN